MSSQEAHSLSILAPRRSALSCGTTGILTLWVHTSALLPTKTDVLRDRGLIERNETHGRDRRRLQHSTGSTARRSDLEGPCRRSGAGSTESGRTGAGGGRRHHLG